MQNGSENVYLLVGVRGVLGTSNSVWWLFLSTTGSSTTFILLFCIISCNILNNSSARAHLKAKIPTNINQEGNSLVTRAVVSSDCKDWPKDRGQVTAGHLAVTGHLCNLSKAQKLHRRKGRKLSDPKEGQGVWDGMLTSRHNKLFSHDYMPKDWTYLLDPSAHPVMG